MNTSDLITKTGWTLRAGSTGKPISSAYVCDLLSWVMAHGTQGTAWITVQTHINVVAVASLHDFSCIIIPENIDISEEVLGIAAEKDVCIISSPLSSYDSALKLGTLGIGSV